MLTTTQYSLRSNKRFSEFVQRKQKHCSIETTKRFELGKDAECGKICLAQITKRVVIGKFAASALFLPRVHNYISTHKIKILRLGKVT